MNSFNGTELSESDLAQLISFHSGKFLLTGVTGFLGSEVFCRLVRSVGFDRVICMVRKKPSKDSVFFKRLTEHGLEKSLDRIRFLDTDFSSTHAFSKVLKSAETMKSASESYVVIHMAAIIHAKTQSELKQQQRLNIEVTDELLDWSALNASHFVYMSSVVAFGATAFLSKARDESDFDRFPWLSKFFSYYTSKRTSHLRVQSRAKIPVTLLCPGIIHGSLESEKSSRKHLQYLREGKLKLAPSGSGNFVGLDRVAQAVVHASMLTPKESKSTRLLVDENMSFADYFNMYVHLARGVDAYKVWRLPALVGMLCVFVYVLLSACGLRVSLLEPLAQGSLHLRFKSLHKQPPTAGLKQNLIESLK